MQNLKLVKRFEIFFLFLATIFFLIITPTILKAQSNNLIGTSWKGTTTYANGVETYFWNFDYIFKDSKEVKVHLVVAVSRFQQKQTYNMITQKYEIVGEYSTTIVQELNETGTYQKNGKSISMNFKSHQIVAEFSGNDLIGKITTYDGAKSVWSAERTLSTSEIKKNELKKNVYGPWESADHLYQAIMNFELDKKMARAGKNDEETRKILKERIFDDVHIFESQWFPELSSRLAGKLNRFLETPVFKDTDFLPPPDPRKPPKFDNGLSEDLGNTPYDWTIRRYIKEIYVPVVNNKIKTFD